MAPGLRSRVEICPQCLSSVKTSVSRLIQDSCGHRKCRLCLLKEEEGCVLCTAGSKETGEPSKLRSSASSSETDSQHNQDSDNDWEAKHETGRCEKPSETNKEVKRRTGKCKKPSQTIKEKAPLGEENEDKEETENSETKLKRVKFTIEDHIAVLPGNPVGYRCTVCNKICKTRRVVRYHNYCLSKNKPYKCEICDRGFVKKSHYDYHVRSHTGIAPFVCSICNKGFKDKTKLTRHLRIHSDENPFVCAECGKRFSQSSSLKIHERTHTGEKLHVCSICSRAFADISNLRSHMVTHKDDQPFMCDECGKLFKQKKTLEAHLRSVHRRERRFTCDMCGRKFIVKRDLQRHLVVHTETKSHSCTSCNLLFRRKDNYERHMKNTHPQMVAAGSKQVKPPNQNIKPTSNTSVNTSGGRNIVEETSSVHVATVIPPSQTINANVLKYVPKLSQCPILPVSVSSRIVKAQVLSIPQTTVSSVSASMEVSETGIMFTEKPPVTVPVSSSSVEVLTPRIVNTENPPVTPLSSSSVDVLTSRIMNTENSPVTVTRSSFINNNLDNTSMTSGTTNTENPPVTVPFSNSINNHLDRSSVEVLKSRIMSTENSSETVPLSNTSVEVSKSRIMSTENPPGTVPPCSSMDNLSNSTSVEVSKSRIMSIENPPLTVPRSSSVDNHLQSLSTCAETEPPREGSQFISALQSSGRSSPLSNHCPHEKSKTPTPVPPKKNIEYYRAVSVISRLGSADKSNSEPKEIEKENTSNLERRVDAANCVPTIMRVSDNIITRSVPKTSYPAEKCASKLECYKKLEVPSHLLRQPPARPPPPPSLPLPSPPPHPLSCPTPSPLPVPSISLSRPLPSNSLSLPPILPFLHSHSSVLQPPQSHQPSPPSPPLPSVDQPSLRRLLTDVNCCDKSSEILNLANNTYLQSYDTVTSGDVSQFDKYNRSNICGAQFFPPVIPEVSNTQPSNLDKQTVSGENWVFEDFNRKYSSREVVGDSMRIPASLPLNNDFPDLPYSYVNSGVAHNSSFDQCTYETYNTKHVDTGGSLRMLADVAGIEESSACSSSIGQPVILGVEKTVTDVICSTYSCNLSENNC